MRGEYVNKKWHSLFGHAILYNHVVFDASRLGYIRNYAVYREQLSDGFFCCLDRSVLIGGAYDTDSF